MKEHLTNIANTREGMDGQNWRLKRIASLITVQPNSFSKPLSLFVNLNDNDLEIYFFVLKL